MAKNNKVQIVQTVSIKEYKCSGPSAVHLAKKIEQVRTSLLFKKPAFEGEGVISSRLRNLTPEAKKEWIDQFDEAVSAAKAIFLHIGILDSEE